VSNGFVYVLGNDSMPGIYKIGMTARSPIERMEQLSSATATPTPFWLAAFAMVKDPLEIEQELHASLRKFRLNESREFFRADLFVIEEHLNASSPGEVFWTIEGQAAVWREGHQRAKREKLEHFLVQDADPIDWPRFCGFD
jgi:hypothetical protein